MSNEEDAKALRTSDPSSAIIDSPLATIGSALLVVVGILAAVAMVCLALVGILVMRGG